MLAEELLAVLSANQGKPGPQLRLERVVPNLVPAALTAGWIGLVIARPLLLVVAVALLANYNWLGVVIFITWLMVAGFVRFSSQWDTQPGVHAARPLTELQSKLSARLQRFVGYEAPVFYDCGFFCTVIPFFAYYTKPPPYYRLWLSSHDGESLYVDWLMPPSGRITSVCLVLHGVNGDSDANYVKDFAVRMADRGVAVGCMVNRGMGDSIVSGPPSSWFSSARTCDIRKVVDDTVTLVGGKVPINLVGFSNGGTMLANYLGKMGDELKGKVNACLCISATLQIDRARWRTTSHIWQYPVCFLLMKKLVPRVCAGAGISLPKDWKSIYTVTALDERLILPYQGYKTLDHYYKAMSAGSSGVWRNISIPTMMLHARDDPVLHVDDTAVPEVFQGNSFVTMLVTGTGGHVGWPSPHSIEERWKFVADVACEYFGTVSQSR